MGHSLQMVLVRAPLPRPKFLDDHWSCEETNRAVIQRHLSEVHRTNNYSTNLVVVLIASTARLGR